MNDLRAFLTLTRMSFRRLVWSINSAMVLLPLLGGGLFVMRRGFHRIEPTEEAFRSFSNFLLFVFASFLIPICALAFGTTPLGAEREEQTLVFLLTRPLPRWQILLAKVVASLLPCFGLTMGAFGLYCSLSGKVGMTAWWAYWPAILGISAGYLAIFHLFAVLFRHPTMLALVYALFVELFIANLPGSIRRLAVNFYGRSLLYHLGAPGGLKIPRSFEPISQSGAYWALGGIIAGSLLVAFVCFQFKEYRDLT